ncbi:MAG: 50S ribosomal protein L3 [Bacteroides sp.]|nr:MAG: 50S ribosomal protein L3 [Bacteroides sp.]
MIGIIGKKIGMTSVYDVNGIEISCTLIKSGPCTVTQVKNIKKDGYISLQIGFEEKKIKNTSKSLLGHFKNAKTSPKHKLKEIKCTKQYLLGEVIDLSEFKVGDYISITGFSKGKGFQGVVKRHGFSGVGGQTHGQHNRLRAPGSLGASSYPSRVFKGIKMAGRMGNNKVTIKNVKIVKILFEKNIIFVKGSIPGSKNSYLTINK